ncbi:MAG: YlqD family protein [Firmicutes bacterium]|nr:YlqD family protein [Bacillota bacterium]
MDRVTVTRPVIVKVVVTEDFKKGLAAQLRESLRRTELELQRLEFEGRRQLMELEKNHPAGVAAARERLAQEKKKREEVRQGLLERLRMVVQLEPGTEVVHGQLESLVEVAVGDSWRRLMAVEIVVRDGLIVAIREAGTG